MEVARWGGHIFEVSPDVIRSFDKLTIKAGSDTDEKTNSKQKYLARKNGKATEVSLTAGLNAFTGADVRAEAMAFADEAQQGKADWIYVGGEKLVPCQLMLTDATVEEIAIAAGGAWTRAQVKLTFKQADLGDMQVKRKSSGKGGKSFVEAALEGMDEALEAAKAALAGLNGEPTTGGSYIRKKGGALSQAISEANAAKEKGRKGGGVAGGGGGKISYEKVE